jgi:hypothetical protein
MARGLRAATPCANPVAATCGIAADAPQHAQSRAFDCRSRADRVACCAAESGKKVPKKKVLLFL